ncbi:molybdenum cofactor guanylyltransferase [Luteolibacter sp. Populi]|uniref:molybdenum cofactor guanylyltransferase n=1 Tax=Luteolibacter sp. Populi TaxID=3230487 RepID=UPI003466253E
MVALILIGGRSTRMGRDKTLIARPDGQRQIDWLVSLARAAGTEPMLSMRDDSPPPCDLPLIRDRHPGGGPLAALEAFHNARPGEPTLLLGGDLFLMDAETLRLLLKGRDPSRNATGYANRLDGQPEPLCTIYEGQSIAQAPQWLARGEYGARRFLKSLAPRVLDLVHPAALDNVNTPLDLKEALAKLSGGVSPKTVDVEHPGFTGRFDTLACTIGGLFEELCFQQRLAPSPARFHPFMNGGSVLWGQAIAPGSRVAYRPVT